MAVLSEPELAYVERCIAEVEHHTAAEVVVATLAAADDYDDVRIFYAGAGSLMLCGIVHLAVPQLTLSALFMLQIALYIALCKLITLPAVLGRLLPRERAARAVSIAAERLFLTHRVFETRAQTGVLILLSELEHRVCVLGDRGAHAVVQDAGWESFASAITESIRAKRAAEGLGKVIYALGNALSQGLPRPDDDVNELDNRVRQHSRL
jgi:putative membrane protein